MKNKLFALFSFAIISYATYSIGQGIQTKLGYLENKELIELSGLAVSHKEKNLFWAINDSGNAPDIFALDANGRNLGKIRIENVKNTDWEAIASGPCEFGLSCLFIADIGDNRAIRDELQIHIFAEPKINSLNLVPDKTLKFNIPNLPHDAESLMVNPKNGEIYLIEKKRKVENDKSQRIFKLVENKPLDDGTNAHLEEFAQIASTINSNEYVGTITDAAFDDNGEYFYFRDYDNVYKSKQILHEGVIIDAVKLESERLKQGESIAKIPNSENLIISSEGLNEKIIVFPIKIFGKN